MALKVDFPTGFFAHRLIASVNTGNMGFPMQYRSYPNADAILAIHSFEFRDIAKNSKKINLGRHCIENFTNIEMVNTVNALDVALGVGLYLPFDRCIFEFELESNNKATNNNGVVVMAEQVVDPISGRNAIYTRIATLQKTGPNEYQPAFFFAQGLSFESGQDKHGFAYYLDDRVLLTDVNDQVALTLLHYPFLCALLALNQAKKTVKFRDAVISGPKGFSGKEARERVIFEYKVLDLDFDSIADTAHRISMITERTQARHDRRGHKRTLKDGRVIYVRPCVINATKDVTKMIMNDYVINL